MNLFSKIFKLGSALALVMVLSLSSCKECDCSTPEDPTTGFSPEIEQIVPQSIIDDLRKNGMQVHEGKVPPKIDGAYLIAPMEVTKRFSENDNYSLGEYIDDYLYKFYDLSSNNQKLSIDYKNVVDSGNFGNGQGAFVSGNGNNFTIFAELDGTSQGIKNKLIQAFSGEVTATGIKNLQMSLFMKSKDADPSSKLIPVGASRMFKDGDGFSEKTNNFRLSVPESTKPQTSACMNCSNSNL